LEEKESPEESERRKEEEEAMSAARARIEKEQRRQQKIKTTTVPDLMQTCVGQLILRKLQGPRMTFWFSCSVKKDDTGEIDYDTILTWKTRKQTSDLPVLWQPEERAYSRKGPEEGSP
jgi:hypothetical protein